MTPLSISDPSPTIDIFEAGAKAHRDLAGRADAMCLAAGTHLSEAVPTLYALSGRFGSLSSSLLEGKGENPAETLATVVDDIAKVGSALASEREAVACLIKLNAVLSRRIDDLADHVRFLSAVVSNVKIEVASIVDSDLRLEGFAESIRQLAKKSEASVGAFQTTHRTLIERLRRAASAQTSFIMSHGGKFETASREILSSLELVSRRRKSVAVVAGEVEVITRQIGVQVQNCVMTLQIGDSSRQRFEHVADALVIAAGVACGQHPAGISLAHDLDDAQIAARLVGALQVAQATATMTDLSDAVGEIHGSLGEIGHAGQRLIEKGCALAGNANDLGKTFLADLESKLTSACALLEACRSSRGLVDDAADNVVRAVSDLQAMAASVATMATDMTILGTNAVVTAYRLGTLGLPLSVIAQHLRSHAIQVTEAVSQVTPALDDVCASARCFATTREGHDSTTLDALSGRIARAVSVFRADDATTVSANHTLAQDIEAVNALLLRARSEIDVFAMIDVDASDAKDRLVAVSDDTGNDGLSSLPRALDDLLRSHYTMDSERRLHVSTLGPDAKPERSTRTVGSDSLWL